MDFTSRVVAECFNRDHRDVLIAINNLKCTNEFKDANFRLSEFKDDKKRVFPQYEITTDGYAMLCLHFTNAKCTMWKEELIQNYRLPLLDWHKVEVRL